MESNTQISPEKRAYARLQYLSERKPILTIMNHEFQVLDISQSGLRFLNQDRKRLDNKVTGRLWLTHGKLLDVEGTIEWEQDNEFGVLLSQFIPLKAFELERMHVISHR